MTLSKTLFATALLATTLTTAASADTIILRGPGIAPAHVMTHAPMPVTPILRHVPQPPLTGPIRCVRAPCVVPVPAPVPTPIRCVRAPCVLPVPVPVPPFPGPYCLSCPPMPLDEPIIVLPRTVLH